MTVILGVDPGITGAISHFIDGRLDEVIDMPIFDTRVDGRALADIFTMIDPDAVYLEDTQPMPKNGSIASFKLGLNTGIVIGAVQAQHIALTRVRPSTWKRRMGLIGQPKDRARGLVTELYPDAADAVRLVKHHGRADAILIGRYGIYDRIHERNSNGEGGDTDRSAGDRALRPDDGRDRHPAGATQSDQRSDPRQGGRRPGVAEVRPLVRPGASPQVEEAE